jgi:hypothetical protein
MLPTIGLSLVDLGPPRAGRRVFPPAPGGGELGALVLLARSGVKDVRR